jgi:hypothetical protein
LSKPIRRRRQGSELLELSGAPAQAPCRTALAPYQADGDAGEVKLVFPQQS